MDPRDDEEAHNFLTGMIAGGAHVEEAGDDGSNIDMYLNMAGVGIEHSGDDADDQAHNAEQEDNVHI
jgi:hypothetical protein